MYCQPLVQDWIIRPYLSTSHHMLERSRQMKTWLDSLGYRDYTLIAASEDASFRSYHRLQMAEQSFIVMDAPPELEPCDQFIKVARKISAAGLSAPEIIQQNLQQGFLVLTDFGNTDYLSVLNDDTEAALYGDALSALSGMQNRIDSDDLPVYDDALLNREMDLFHDWFLPQLLGVELTGSQMDCWLSVKQRLVANALAQPQVFVHRDYHSRNLMKIGKQNPAILDFQDAVQGPVTYDLVSLLRDCYISWPKARIEHWLKHYFDRAVANRLVEVEYDQFRHWFNLMGVQRHLKAIGIFSRLHIRDGKPGYLKDIPRTLAYVSQVSAEEASLAELESLITELDLSTRVDSLS